MSFFGIQGLVLLAIATIFVLKIARKWAATKSTTIPVVLLSSGQRLYNLPDVDLGLVGERIYHLLPGRAFDIEPCGTSSSTSLLFPFRGPVSFSTGSS